MKISIKWKLILLFSLSFIIGTAAIGIYTVSTVKKEVLSSAQQKLVSDLRLGEAYLDKVYPGDWSIKDNKLYKGTALINGDFTIVDEIGNLTGDTVTIFQGDTRIATNVQKENGERAVGTTVSDEVANKTLKQGENFIGEANVVGTINQTAYKPIRNSENEVIGIWYVGVPNTPYEKMVDSVQSKLVMFILIELLIFALIFWFMIHRGTRVLSHVSQVTNKVAQGDLTETVLIKKGKDEISQLGISVNNMVENLRDIINEVNIASEQVSSSSEEFNASADESKQAAEQMALLAQQTTEDAENQLQSVYHASSSIQQMASGINEITNTSEMMREKTVEAIQSTKNGSHSIQNVVNQMNDIHASVEETTGVIGNLRQHSDQIANILDFITDIAEQTNLLALNAAIEAARAGEHGKGFAVVADEVRKLAEESKTATEKISTFIKDIQTEIETAVSSMNDGSEKVVSGLSFTQDAEQAFGEIERSTLDMNESVESVAISIKEVKSISTEIVDIIESVKQISEKNMSSSQETTAATEEQLATIEEITASAQSLAELSEDLTNSVVKFKIANE